MITGNETIKELFNKRWSKKDYNTDNDYFIYHLLYGYLKLNIDENDCIEIDNDFVVKIASFLEDSEYICDFENISQFLYEEGVINIREFFNKDCRSMFDKAKDKIWNGDYAWEGTTKFNFQKMDYDVEITDEQYHYQCKIDDMIDEYILEKRCNEYT